MYTSYVTIYINSKTDKIRLWSRSWGAVSEWEEAAELGAGCAIYLTGECLQCKKINSRLILLFYHFYLMEKETGLERLNNLPRSRKIGRTGIRTQFSPRPEPFA